MTDHHSPPSPPSPPPPNPTGKLFLKLKAGSPETHAETQLVGFIISDRFINIAAVVRILTQVWTTIGRFHIEPARAANVYSIFAPSAAAADQVLERGPWSVMGNSVSVHPWPHHRILEDILLHLISFWIQIHGLPRDLMTEENARLIAGQVGQVLIIEDPHSLDVWRGYLRVCFQIDSRNPLVPGFWFDLNDIEATWAEIHYERLSDMCFSCSHLGHTLAHYQITRHPSAARMGAWLATPSPRRLPLIVKGIETGFIINVCRAVIIGGVQAVFPLLNLFGNQLQQTELGIRLTLLWRVLSSKLTGAWLPLSHLSCCAIWSIADG